MFSSNVLIQGQLSTIAIRQLEMYTAATFAHTCQVDERQSIESTNEQKPCPMKSLAHKPATVF